MPNYQLRVLGRFNNLPALGAQGALVALANTRRKDLLLFNAGSARAYLSHEATELSLRNAFPLADSGVLGFNAPIVPQNDLFAVGDVGHDLYVLEVVDVEL